MKRIQIKTQERKSWLICSYAQVNPGNVYCKYCPLSKPRLGRTYRGYYCPGVERVVGSNKCSKLGRVLTSL